MTSTEIESAEALMLAFADRTGLGRAGARRRYLWTDAFAVCNFLGLGRLTGETRYSELALKLIEQTHQVLGRRRGDGSGWLSGLAEQAGAAHPTQGGLRIGKPLPERAPDEPFDDRLEWDRDGQYFHYLTKWMHALDQAARAVGQPRLNVWARELGEVAHRAFACGPPGHRRMVWKMSTDLTRPLVPSMGQHDALDGLLTCAQLESSAAELGAPAEGPRLTAAAADFATMIAGQDLATADPLGLGGLLVDAARAAALVARGALPDATLPERLLDAALEGLPDYARGGELTEPASQRLAFRELGLAIGLDAARTASPAPGGKAQRAALAVYDPLAAVIAGFWSEPSHQKTPAWSAHRDINEVMLATALAPAGFLRW
jgi:hypothetical protein